MAFTPQIQKAITFAIKAHAGQKRKGKPDIPYITHPLSVAIILARIGASEDVITAGILHDIVEDTKHELEDVRKEFGNTVAELVKAVTEEDKELPWEERQNITLAHIPEMNRDTLLLKSADVLHNLSDLVRDREERGEAVFEIFNASKEKKIEQQKKLVEAFEDAWLENPLLLEMKALLKRLTL